MLDKGLIDKIKYKPQTYRTMFFFQFTKNTEEWEKWEITNHLSLWKV